MALDTLEGVAARIVFERFRVTLQVLEPLAERETQVVSIDHRARRRRFRGAHLLQLRFREAVGLQVRQAPPGIAEAGASGRGVVVGGDRRVAPPERLERVSDRQVQIGRLCGAAQQ
jgi:hypothetical protein